MQRLYPSGGGIETHAPGFRGIKQAYCVRAIVLALAASALSAFAADEPITLAKMGAFAFGGTVVTFEKSTSLHCDHGYAQFQIPLKPRTFPIVFWHSASTITWETTPDGRDGFQSIFLRRGFSTYIIDLPRQGRAALGCKELLYKPRPGLDQYTFASWRFGTWNPPEPPRFFPGVQVPTDNPAWLDQLLRARYSESTGGDANEREPDSVKALLDKIGDSIIVTHSGSGIVGWITVTKSAKVKAIVSYEPVDFIFPAGRRPAAVKSAADGAIQEPGIEVSAERFAALKRTPIQIVYGDFIPNEPDSVRGPERRRISMQYAKTFVDEINKIGGDAQLLHLPDIGIKGNTHLLMLDLNNVQIADVLSKFISDKKLDGWANR